MNRHLTDMIIKYEMGKLEWRDTIALFQELIDNGMAWSLQGHYGKMAKALIEQGYCEQSHYGRVAKALIEAGHCEQK